MSGQDCGEVSLGSRAPQLEGIELARRRLDGKAGTTPLLRSERLDDRLGLRLLAKAEMLQYTGSYKFRGAYNLLASLGPAQRQLGFVTFSSGNYAQALAAAARAMGAKVSIVMPADAPRVKTGSTRFYGAEIIQYDRASESREQVMRSIAEERGARFSHPHEEASLIEGYGTVGLELMEQARALDSRPDALLVPCSGGCLLAGVGLAARASDPGVDLFGVEPVGFDDMARSLATGQPVALAEHGRSICDALLSDRPGTLPFGLLCRLNARMLTASDELCLEAMALAFEYLRVVCEPSGAIALAAVLAEHERFAGRTVAVVLSGGNVTADAFRLALAPHARRRQGMTPTRCVSPET